VNFSFFSGKAKRKSGFWTFINVQFSFLEGGLGMKNISLVTEKDKTVMSFFLLLIMVIKTVY
jgi:hypothetical protein